MSMKLVSDDPHFRFANGQTGTYTKGYKLRPMQGMHGQHLPRFSLRGKAQLARGPGDEFYGVGRILQFGAFLLLHAAGDGHRRKTRCDGSLFCRMETLGR